ncbi:MAG: YIP1 family protein [Nitrospirales bacterium]|nr:YIP1 family protein [Nitrospira sp.]MDR4500889.1 YIP1 family protein [Nitrospirales bacterium]
MSEASPKDNQPLATAILEDVVTLLTNPVSFYRRMPKTGGYGDPILFLMVIAVITAVMMAIFSLFGLGTVGEAMAVGFGGIIFLPMMTLVLSFIGAGLLFIVWKFIGSKESFEVAYRCVAYASALFPISAIAGMIPYLGSIVGIVWWTYLMIVASIEVHHLPPQTAYVVLGIIGFFFVVTNLSSEIAARRLATEFEQYGGSVKQLEELSPEEAGEAVGKFLKGLEKSRQEP